MPADGRWDLTLILLTWRIWWAPNNASKYRWELTLILLTWRTSLSYVCMYVCMCVYVYMFVLLQGKWIFSNKCPSLLTCQQEPRRTVWVFRQTGISPHTCLQLVSAWWTVCRPARSCSNGCSDTPRTPSSETNGQPTKPQKHGKQFATAFQLSSATGYCQIEITAGMWSRGICNDVSAVTTAISTIS